MLNAGWSWFLISRGRRWRSPALIADGRHLLADVVTSAGVLVGVALVALTGQLVLDPLLAALVALNILWSGCTRHVGRRTFVDFHLVVPGEMRVDARRHSHD